MSGVIGKIEFSSVERIADGQTTSPVFEFTNCVPRIPGMTTTGRFPFLARASAKIRSRFGVCLGLIHPEPKLMAISNSVAASFRFDWCARSVRGDMYLVN